MIPDAELLRRYAYEDSEAAFTELVQRYANMVFNSALRRVGGNAHLATDVAQTVFRDLARKAKTLCGRPVLTGWLFTSTRYAAAQAVRTERRRSIHEREAHLMNAVNSPEALNWEHIRGVIDDAMDRLSATDREVVLLRFFENRPFAEIGAALGLSEDGARKRIDRALVKLRGVLQRRGVTSTAAALLELLAQQPITAAPVELVSPAAVHGIITAAQRAAAPSVGTSVFLSKTTLISAAAFIGLACLTWRWHEIKSLTFKPALPAPAHNVDRSAATPDANSLNPPPLAAEADVVDFNDPALRRTLAARAKSRLDIFYAPLFTRLALSDRQLDEFKDLIVQKQLLRTDARQPAHSQGLHRRLDPALYYEAIDRVQKDVNRQIQQLLGDASFTVYVSYERTLEDRIAVQRFVASLPPTDPLSSELQEQLIAIIAKHNASDVHGTIGLSISAGAGVIDPPMAAIRPAALEEAKKILSPTQWDLLRAESAAIHRERTARHPHVELRLP